ncbi:MAG: hypothetical protein SAK29_17010 [Scytonema sp. PMC 1069.18]|nr:hypothetical protein [Scytonema sp. PMC 1069.18]MEC4882699.1 hypothetical protein [Scytonema sp. PMC 1070.18]
MSVTQGAQINAFTNGRGNAGSVTISADGAVKFDGVGSSDGFPTGSFSTVEAGAIGDGGTININAGSLSLTNGGLLGVFVRAADSDDGLAGGQGNGGNVNINVDDTLTISGKNGSVESGIFSSLGSGAIGVGGNINIKAGSFVLTNDAELSASTSGKGNAGNIDIQVDSDVQITGDDTRIVSNVRRTGEGNGGTISINANSVAVTEGAQVNTSVENRNNGTNKAGDLTINARFIDLSNQGRLTATTESGDGGNIILNVKDVLLLRNNSSISATAGITGSGGNGGNITINAPRGFIVTIPNQNSDITANAFNGQGGNINIKVAGTFGIAPLSRQELESLRPDDLDPGQLITNDITAISRENPSLSGRVSINNPDIDPSQGLVNLPTVLTDTSVLIDRGCATANSEGSEFIVTGRGGLPPHPYEFISNDVVWSDNRITTLPSSNEEVRKFGDSRNAVVSLQKPVTPSIPKTYDGVPIIPATGWVFNGKGEVTLISHTSGAADMGSTAASCSQR